MNNMQDSLLIQHHIANDPAGGRQTRRREISSEPKVGISHLE